MNDRSESTDSAIARGILTGEVKALIQARAYSFDPARLIDLLAYYGVPREDITFESNPDRASASTIDSIRFQDDGRVLVRVNMGLLGDTGTAASALATSGADDQVAHQVIQRVTSSTSIPALITAEPTIRRPYPTGTGCPWAVVFTAPLKL